MGDKLDKLELYPGFIELSLHLMNIQALMRDKKINTSLSVKVMDDKPILELVQELPDVYQTTTF